MVRIATLPRVSAAEATPVTVAIRPAVAADAAAIAEIYNQGIEDRVATLETALRLR